jgi:hypothetical protein
VDGSMDFIQVMVVSTFDILFIIIALMVDGIGYAAWLICAAVFHNLYDDLLIFRSMLLSSSLFDY